MNNVENNLGYHGSFETAGSSHRPRFAKDTDMMQSAVALQGWTTATSDRAGGANSDKRIADHSQINQPIWRLA
jgi:hypothetical protein